MTSLFPASAEALFTGCQTARWEQVKSPHLHQRPHCLPRHLRNRAPSFPGLRTCPTRDLHPLGLPAQGTGKGCCDRSTPRRDAMNKTQIAQLDRIITDLESLRDEVQADFDERSERWREGERGQTCKARLTNSKRPSRLLKPRGMTDELATNDLPLPAVGACSTRWRHSRASTVHASGISGRHDRTRRPSDRCYRLHNERERRRLDQAPAKGRVE